jgi:hypothetical protein
VQLASLCVARHGQNAADSAKPPHAHQGERLRKSLLTPLQPLKVLPVDPPTSTKQQFKFPIPQGSLDSHRWQQLLPQSLCYGMEEISGPSKSSPKGPAKSAAAGAVASTSVHMGEGFVNPCMSHSDVGSRQWSGANISSSACHEELHAVPISHGDSGNIQSVLYCAMAQDSSKQAGQQHKNDVQSKVPAGGARSVLKPCSDDQEAPSKPHFKSLSKLACILQKHHPDSNATAADGPDSSSDCTSPLAVFKLAQPLSLTSATLQDVLHRPGLLATTAADEWAAALSVTPAFGHMPGCLMEALLKCFQLVSLPPGTLLIGAHAPVGTTYAILSGHVIQQSGRSTQSDAAQAAHGLIAGHSGARAAAATRNCISLPEATCCDGLASSNLASSKTDIGPGWLIGSIHMVSGSSAELGLQVCASALTPTLALALTKADFQACLWEAGIRALLASQSMGYFLAVLCPARLLKVLQCVGLLKVPAGSPLCVEASQMKSATALVQGWAVVCCSRSESASQLSHSGISCNHQHGEQAVHSGQQADSCLRSKDRSVCKEQVVHVQNVDCAAFSDVSAVAPEHLCGRRAALRRDMSQIGMSLLGIAVPGCFLGGEYLPLLWSGRGLQDDASKMAVGMSACRPIPMKSASADEAWGNAHLTSAVMATDGWVVVVDVVGLVQEASHHISQQNVQTALATAALSKRATQQLVSARRQKKSLSQASIEHQMCRPATYAQASFSPEAADSKVGRAAGNALGQGSSAAPPTVSLALLTSECNTSHQGVQKMSGGAEKSRRGLEWEDEVLVLRCLDRMVETRLTGEVEDICRRLAVLEDFGCALDNICMQFT